MGRLSEKWEPSNGPQARACSLKPGFRISEWLRVPCVGGGAWDGRQGGWGGQALPFGFGKYFESEFFADGGPFSHYPPTRFPTPQADRNANNPGFWVLVFFSERI